MLDEQTRFESNEELAAHLKSVAEAENLVDMVEAGELISLGRDVIKHFDIDRESMTEWTEKMETAIKLATLVKEEKNYPFDNPSNVCFPLVTSAALQYNARAYPAIVPSSDVVKVAVHGSDKDGAKAARAKRVASWSTWQLKVDSREWERGTDQLLMQLPIVGDMFRKMWWDPELGRVRSKVRIPGKHVVVNNNATSLDTAPRVSEIITMYPHQVETRKRSGWFTDFELKKVTEDSEEPVEFIEQQCRVDLDGDGYAEPYIVTVYKEDETVVRVVAGFEADEVRVAADEPRIIAIEASSFFIHYQFMPSMDGGFFGTGLGLLLGDISENINSTINMINDAGKMQSLGGGFLAAKDFRIKGGVNRRKPGEYKHVNFYGDDIRKGLVDIQHPGPSPVLFSMLGMMVDAGREIASVQDIMTGDAGRQNMPVGTVLALIEQGQMVFTASYKRIYGALQDEFTMLCKINARHLDPEKYNAFLDESSEEEQTVEGQEAPQQAQQMQHDPAADFNLSDMDIQPVADPKSVTSMQAMGRAQFLLELAEKGMVDMGEATMRILNAASIDDSEKLIPKPDPMANAMQEAQSELMILEIKLKEAEVEDLIASAQAKMAKAVKDLGDAEQTEIRAPMQAKIDEFTAMKEMLNARREQLGGMAGKSSDGRAA